MASRALTNSDASITFQADVWHASEYMHSSAVSSGFIQAEPRQLTLGLPTRTTRFRDATLRTTIRAGINKWRSVAPDITHERTLGLNREPGCASAPPQFGNA
eukprot:4478849-Prymnesium_polylepis.3